MKAPFRRQEQSIHKVRARLPVPKRLEAAEYLHRRAWQKSCSIRWRARHQHQKFPPECMAKKWFHVAPVSSSVPSLTQNKAGQRTQKQDGTQHAFFTKSCGVGSCALHEIDVRALLKHCAHWWYQGPQFTTACCASYVYILLAAISANVINSIPSF